MINILKSWAESVFKISHLLNYYQILRDVITRWILYHRVKVPEIPETARNNRCVWEKCLWVEIIPPRGHPRDVRMSSSNLPLFMRLPVAVCRPWNFMAGWERWIREKQAVKLGKCSRWWWWQHVPRFRCRRLTSKADKLDEICKKWRFSFYDLLPKPRNLLWKLSNGRYNFERNYITWFREIYKIKLNNIFKIRLKNKAKCLKNDSNKNDNKNKIVLV